MSSLYLIISTTRPKRSKEPQQFEESRIVYAQHVYNK